MLANTLDIGNEACHATIIKTLPPAPDRYLSQDASHVAWLLDVGCRLTKWGSLIPRPGR
jgi:hypothetical protein